MATPLGASRIFTIQRDDEGSNMPIQLFEQSGISADNLSLTTWGSSFVLANRLHKLKLPTPQARGVVGNDSMRQYYSILELGAGTGLVGICAAALWSAEVLVTDLPPLLPGLEANAQLNEHLLSGTKSMISVGVLDWNCSSEIQPLSEAGRSSITPQDWNADVILAADTIYSEEHPELIVNVIRTWLSPGPSSRAILCYPLRIAYLSHVQRFWELMESEGLECLHEGREDGAEDWNEVANTPFEWCVWAWRDHNAES